MSADAVWQGRLSKPLDPRAQRLNDSLPVDGRLWPEELALTRAYAMALIEAHVLQPAEAEALIGAAGALEADLLSGQTKLAGEDVHSATAAGIIGADPDAISPGERSKAKMVNYGIAYGLSAYGLADRLSIPQEEAATYIDRYFERFAGVKRFIDETIESAREEGCVRTLMGRRRLIPELRSRNWQTRTLGERLAVNTVIQGTAADIIKRAMVRIAAALRAQDAPRARMILQVHDELVFEVAPADLPEVRELVEGEMKGVARLSVPVEVHVGSGKTWLEAH